jgi:hypothetical protein
VTAALIALAVALVTVGDGLWSGGGNGTLNVTTVAADDDRQPVEVGVRFTPLAPAEITGIRYYKPGYARGTQEVHLWDSSGTLLGSAEARGAKGEGWQEVLFAAPVPILPGQRYVASYWAPEGYWSEENKFDMPSQSGALLLPAAAGVYQYGKSGMPTASWHNSTYFVEPLLQAVATPVTAPVATPSATATTLPAQAPEKVAPKPAAAPAAAKPVSTRGCLARPSACGYPDETNTGVPNGVSLSRYTGPMRVTQAGTVIDGKLIEGNLVIAANNVTLRNSRVVNTVGNSDIPVVRINEGFTGGVVQDVTIEGNGRPCNAGIVLAGRGGLAQRLNVSGCADFFDANEGTHILDSYGHDRMVINGAHSDGIQTLGDSHFVFRHNTLIMPGGSGVNSLITIGNEYNDPTDVLIADNLLNGGGFTLDIASTASNVRVTGNRFGTDYSYGINKVPGLRLDWSSNVVDASGAAIPLN